MPAPAPFLSSNPINQPLFPALYLYPLNDSFIPKHITLAHGQRVKIGRQTNAKTSPAERNGFFDSKVLSRQHAEVWEDGGKIYIKDVKSSNGTFINGERLSPEGLESEPFELKSDDIVEFGIDIVGEDNKTIIHHKVAARVLCVFNEQEAQVAARAEQHQGSSSMGGITNQPGSSGSGNQFNFAGGQGQPGTAQRRPPLQAQGLGGMGGMGGSMRPPGKSGLTFDHILSRLQGELQKSRETGAELHSLTGAMNEIHDTLGGSLPQNVPSYPQSLPPVRQSQQQNQSDGASSSSDQPAAPPASALSELQSQLHNTQTSLSTHVDKIRALEGMLAEHEAIKREVSSLREMMEERKREMEMGRSAERRDEDAHEDRSREYAGDEDDAASIRTVVPHELERVEEEDEDQIAAEEEEEDRRRRREELGRPRTPEPTGMGMHEDDDEPRRKHLSASRHRSPSPSAHDHPSPAPPSVVDELTNRLTSLANQLESALELSSTLQAQHTAAQTTITVLESKVSALELLVQETQGHMQAQASAQEAARAEAAEAARQPAEEHERERESLTQMLNDWKKTVEGQWSNVQEEWHAERERLSKAREEWEDKAKAVDTALGSTVAKVDSGLASLAAFQAQQPRHLPNGDLKNNGLVTPPSPRSLSADSNRPRQRRKRTSSSRGRSRSHSPVGTDSTAVEELADQSGMEGSSVHPSPFKLKSDSYSPPGHDDLSDSESVEKDHTTTAGRYLATPESIHQVSTSGAGPFAESSKDHSIKAPISDLQLTHVSTAIGVLVLGVAAAAVIWRVKPE